MADDGYQAGSAYVQVLPDFRGFHKKIEAALRDEEGTFEKFGDESGKLFVNGFSERLRAGFEHLPHARIKADADTRKADDELDKAARNRKSKITVEAVAKQGAKLGTFGTKDLLGLLGLAVGPQALGLGALAAGGGIAAGAALGGLGAFALVAKGEVAKVQAAQKALTTAQGQYATAEASYAKATTKAQKTAALAAEVKALAAERKAVAGLSPAERDLAKEITGLTGAWSALGKAEAPVIASALGPWVSAATSGMRLLKPIVDDVGGAVGFLGDEATAAVKSPFWDEFSQAFGATASAGILGFGDAIGKVADGIAHLFVDFAPDIQQIPFLFDKWAGSFDKWAKSYDKSGFEKFIDTTLSKGNVSALKGDLGAVADILKNTAKATAGFSPLAFTGLSNVLSILARMSPGQIEAIAALYGATRVVGTVSKVAGAIGTVVGAGKKLLGGGASAAEGAEEGAAAGTSFTTSFTETASAELPEAFTALGAEGAAEALAAGDALGASAGAGFAAGLGEDAAAAAAALPEAITGVVLGAFLAGSGVGAAAGAGFAFGFTAASLVVGRAAGKLSGWVTGPAKNAGSWLTADGRAAAVGFATGYGSASGIVSGTAAKTRGWVSTGVGNMSGTLQPAGRETTSGFLRGMLANWNPVTGFLGAIAPRALRIVGNLSGLLWHAGSSVMGGFLAGLESQWGAITSFVGGIAGWIKSHKGPIAYDRTLLTPHGEAVMGSFYAGLLHGYAPVQSFIGGIAPAIAAAPSLPGVTSPVRGGTAITFRFVRSGDALGDALVSHLQMDIQATTGGDVQARLGRGKART